MDQDHVKEQIKADLTFAHQMMMATNHMARLREQNIEAEVAVVHALLNRLSAGIQHRGMPLAAIQRYERLFITPQRHRVERARIASVNARAEANKWSRAHDEVIERASAYRGWS